MSELSIPDRWVIEDDYKKETVWETDFATDVLVNQGSMNTDYEEHCVTLSRWATLSELCEDYTVRMKDELKRVESSLDIIVREDMVNANVKPTEGKVAKTILMRAEYVQQQDKYNAAKLQSGLAKRALECIMCRKDMLIGLGANYRAEGQSTFHLNK